MFSQPLKIIMDRLRQSRKENISIDIHTTFGTFCPQFSEKAQLISWNVTGCFDHPVPDHRILSEASVLVVVLFPAGCQR